MSLYENLRVGDVSDSMDAVNLPGVGLVGDVVVADGDVVVPRAYSVEVARIARRVLDRTRRDACSSIENWAFPKTSRYDPNHLLFCSARKDLV